MKALRFVLAIPIGPPRAASRSIEVANEPSEVCDSVPRLWTEEATPVTKFDTASFVLGALFAKQAESAVTGPKLVSGASTPSPTAGSLVRECWGAYFAVFTCHNTGAIEVMVDPSGLLPVYRFATPTHHLFASHPALFGQAAGEALRVSWQNVRSYLLRPELRQRSTCLDGVTELPPGRLLPACGTRSDKRWLWQPGDFIPGSRTMAFEEAKEQLRSLAISTIGAWADLLGPVTVAASGGVDSSFICGALARHRTSFDCITIATADASGDERRFVDILGRHLGVDTISATYDPKSVDPLQSASAGLARPSRRSFLAALDAALRDASQSVGASVIFDGNAGDNLFCFLHSAAPIVDRLRCEGPGRGALSTFFDMCRLTGCDIPTMAKAVARRMARRKRRAIWPTDRRLLLDIDEASEVVDPLLPWLDSPVGRHDGKRDHLAFMMRNQNHVHGLGASGLPRFSPLMSQPLLEFCLSVPTWLWCKGGVNRALAREAFADVLPREILARTSKAGPDSFVRRSFHEHRSAIRNLLMEGLLARHGIVDRAAVDAALTTDIVSGGEIIYRLLDLAEAENWARSWDRE